MRVSQVFFCVYVCVCVYGRMSVKRIQPTRELLWTDRTRKRKRERPRIYCFGKQEEYSTGVRDDDDNDDDGNESGRSNE